MGEAQEYDLGNPANLILIYTEASAHRYICNNLNYLAFTVRPNEQDFSFLANFLNSPSLKALIDVSGRSKGGNLKPHYFSSPPP